MGPEKNRNLHGNAPDEAPIALLLIDVINDLEFDGGDRLLAQALPMADRLATLRSKAKHLGIPVVYVNDNFGKWQSDFGKLLAHCLRQGVRGRPLAERLRPDEDDYFVLKPKHSGFFSTTLATLLDYLGAETLILTGLTAEACVLFTAADAYMRDYDLIVPSDCVASADPEDRRRALHLIARVLKSDTRLSTELELDALVTRPPRAA